MFARVFYVLLVSMQTFLLLHKVVQVIELIFDTIDCLPETCSSKISIIIVIVQTRDHILELAIVFLLYLDFFTRGKHVYASYAGQAMSGLGFSNMSCCYQVCEFYFVQ